MNIQKYKAFVVTVETGSFTKAAEALNYSQSGVSRMINDLEKEWQVTLLNRGKGGVKLTSDGMRLLPHARGVIAEFEKLQSKVNEIKGIETGLIRVGVFSGVAIHWMPTIIAAFRAQYPNVDFELLSGDYATIETWIEEGQADCGFLSLPTTAELETIFMEQDALMAVIPEGHPLAEAPMFPVAAFCDEPFVFLERGNKSEAAEIFEQCDLKPPIRYRTHDEHAVLAMVEKGLGISILPELILKRTPYKIIAKPLDVPAYRNIGFALKNKNAASLAVKRLMTYLNVR